MLSFNAIKYKNNTSGFFSVKDTLPVKVEDGKYTLPSEAEILVKVHAAALNPVDILIKNALSPLVFKGDKGIGMDYSGEVVAIGSKAAEITSFKVGDRIAGLYQSLLGTGTCAEYILINPKKSTGSSARKLPDHISYKIGASYPLVLGTAQTVFSRIPEGNAFKKVLILGAGTTVGRCCVQLAHNVYGFKEIVVTCSAKSEQAITELGATSVIDYTQHKSILQPVLESVKQSGEFDAILDCCGNSDLFPEITHIIKPRNQFGSYLSIVGDNKANFAGSVLNVFSNFYSWLRSIRSIIGLLPYYYAVLLVDATGSWPDACAKFIAEGKVRMFIDSEYTLDNVQEAADKLMTNKAVGKVVINVTPDN